MPAAHASEVIDLTGCDDDRDVRTTHSPRRPPLFRAPAGDHAVSSRSPVPSDPLRDSDWDWGIRQDRVRDHSRNRSRNRSRDLDRERDADRSSSSAADSVRHGLSSLFHPFGVLGSLMRPGASATNGQTTTSGTLGSSKTAPAVAAVATPAKDHPAEGARDPRPGAAFASSVRTSSYYLPSAGWQHPDDAAPAASTRAGPASAPTTPGTPSGPDAPNASQETSPSPPVKDYPLSSRGSAGALLRDRVTQPSFPWIMSDAPLHARRTQLSDSPPPGRAYPPPSRHMASAHTLHPSLTSPHRYFSQQQRQQQQQPQQQPYHAPDRRLPSPPRLSLFHYNTRKTSSPRTQQQQQQQQQHQHHQHHHQHHHHPQQPLPQLPSQQQSPSPSLPLSHPYHQSSMLYPPGPPSAPGRPSQAAPAPPPAPAPAPAFASSFAPASAHTPPSTTRATWTSPPQPGVVESPEHAHASISRPFGSSSDVHLHVHALPHAHTHSHHHLYNHTSAQSPRTYLPFPRPASRESPGVSPPSASLDLPPIAARVENMSISPPSVAPAPGSASRTEQAATRQLSSPASPGSSSFARPPPLFRYRPSSSQETRSAKQQEPSGPAEPGKFALPNVSALSVGSAHPVLSTPEASTAAESALRRDASLQAVGITAAAPSANVPSPRDPAALRSPRGPQGPPVPTAPPPKSLSLSPSIAETSGSVSLSSVFTSSPPTPKFLSNATDADTNARTSAESGEDVANKDAAGRRGPSTRAAAVSPVAPVEPKTEWTTPKLETRLREFVDSLHTDHGRTVEVAIASQRQQEYRHRSSFDAFAHIPSQHLESASAKVDHVKVRIKTHRENLRRPDVTRMLLAKAVSWKSPGEAVPRYRFHHVEIGTNILSPNTPLKFIPHIRDLEEGSDDKKKFDQWIEELESMEQKSGFDSSKRVDKWASTRAAEYAKLVSGYLDEWLASLGIDDLTKATLIRHMARGPRSSGGSQAMTPQQKSSLLSSCGAGGSDTPHAVRVARMFTEAFNRVFAARHITLYDVLKQDEAVEAVFDPKKTIPKSKEDQDDDDQSLHQIQQYLSTYTSLACIICNTHSCEHGEFDAENVRRCFSIDDLGGKLWQHVQRRRQRQARDREHAASGPARFDNVHHPPTCENKCYQLYDDGSTAVIERPWDDIETSLLRSIHVTLGASVARTPCVVSFNLGNRYCWEVYRRMKELGLPIYSEAAVACIGTKSAGTGAVTAPPVVKPVTWYDRHRKVLNGDWQEHTVTHLHALREQREPCNHDGPCTAARGCPCVEAKLLCERFCRCTAETCAYKFTGCACHGSGKTCYARQKEGKPCICVLLNRECDPVLCGGCGARERANPANRDDDELFATGCQNVALQRGKSKAVVLGQSQLEGCGYGLFTAEDIAADEFVAEYMGELITHDEGVRREARRGDVFNQESNASYLFTLLEQDGIWVDAAIYGNLSRYINHASENDKRGCNITPKILYVNGEFRIRFTAMRDIKTGEELFFNYGENFPNLTKKLLEDKASASEEDGSGGARGGNGDRGKLHAGNNRRTGGGGGGSRSQATKGQQAAARARKSANSRSGQGTGSSIGNGNSTSNNGAAASSLRRANAKTKGARKEAPPVVVEPTDVEMSDAVVDGGGGGGSGPAARRSRKRKRAPLDEGDDDDSSDGGHAGTGRDDDTADAPDPRQRRLLLRLRLREQREQRERLSSAQATSTPSDAGPRPRTRASSVGAGSDDGDRSAAAAQQQHTGASPDTRRTRRQARTLREEEASGGGGGGSSRTRTRTAAATAARSRRTRQSDGVKRDDADEDDDGDDGDDGAEGDEDESPVKPGRPHWRKRLRTSTSGGGGGGAGGDAGSAAMDVDSDASTPRPQRPRARVRVRRHDASLSASQSRASSPASASSSSSSSALSLSDEEPTENEDGRGRKDGKDAQTGGGGGGGGGREGRAGRGLSTGQFYGRRSRGDAAGTAAVEDMDVDADDGDDDGADRSRQRPRLRQKPARYRTGEDKAAASLGGGGGGGGAQ